MLLSSWPLRAGLLAGAAFGVGAAVVAPTVFRMARPSIKKALKAGFATMSAAQVAAYRAGEGLEDLFAEVAHELTSDQQHAAAAAARTAATATAAANRAATRAAVPPAQAANS